MSTRTPRGRRGTAATLVALIGLLLCAAAAVEALWLAVHDTTWGFDPSTVASHLRRTTLGSSTTLAVGLALAVLGLLVLIAGIVPARRHLVELGGDDAEVATGVTRRSLRRTLAASARSVDGISNASVTLRRRRVKVHAATELRRTDGLDERVRAATAGRLADLAPRKARTVRVRLTIKES